MSDIKWAFQLFFHFAYRKETIGRDIVINFSILKSGYSKTEKVRGFCLYISLFAPKPIKICV